MHMRVELMLTTAERAERYFEGIHEGDSRYEGPSFVPTDTEEDVQKGNEKRDQQHTELLALIRALQGSTSQSYRNGPSLDDRDFTPSDRLGGHQDGIGHDTGRGGSGPTKTVLFEDLTVDHSSPLLHDLVHFLDLTVDWSSQLQPDLVQVQDLTTDRSSQRSPPADPNVAYPSNRSKGTDLACRDPPLGSIPRRSSSHHSSSHRRDAVEPNVQTPSSHRRDPVDPNALDRSPPPLRRQARIRQRGLQQRSLCTDPCRSKRPRIMPPPPHEWMPHKLVDPNQFEAYHAYKRAFTGELCDVDLHELVGVTWFHRFQTNFMELEDTHIDAYLKILPKRQRAYPAVYGSRTNILDSQFYSLLCHTWDRLQPTTDNKPPQGWSVLNQQWPHDELMVEVPFKHKNAQVACLRYLLPSMLNAVHFHRNIRYGDKTYKLKDGPFQMRFVSTDRVPQQDKGKRFNFLRATAARTAQEARCLGSGTSGEKTLMWLAEHTAQEARGNCGAHTLRMIEYLTANRDQFDWKEADMATIWEKMAVEGQKCKIREIIEDSANRIKIRVQNVIRQPRRVLKAGIFQPSRRFKVARARRVRAAGSCGGKLAAYIFSEARRDWNQEEIPCARSNCGKEPAGQKERIHGVHRDLRFARKCPPCCMYELAGKFQDSPRI
ncbi:hypothetical protein Q3G72_021308 [Acer saccharum]|nr:hypothetical protein Q3G72_021308 [Acer saccharum]